MNTLGTKSLSCTLGCQQKLYMYILVLQSQNILIYNMLFLEMNKNTKYLSKSTHQEQNHCHALWVVNRNYTCTFWYCNHQIYSYICYFQKIEINKNTKYANEHTRNKIIVMHFGLSIEIIHVHFFWLLKCLEAYVITHNFILLSRHLMATLTVD